MSHDFRLDPWTVRPDLGTIENGSTRRRLSHKVMAVLVCLAEKPGQPVTKDELFEQAWEGTFASDEALSTVVYELRKALGDDARDPRFVETLRKSGYRLIARVEPLDEPPPAGRPPARRHPRWRPFATAAALGLASLAGALLLAGGWSTTFDTPGPTSGVARENAPKLARVTTEEASEAIALGSHFLSQGTAEGTRKARGYFALAIGLDPELAPAHVGLADSWIAATDGLPAESQADAYRQAKEAAETALAIDEHLPSAHASLASIYFQHEWDWTRAEEHFQRGVAGRGIAGSGVAGRGVAGSGIAGSGIAWRGIAGRGIAGRGIAGSGASSTECSVEISRRYAAYLSAMGRHHEAVSALEDAVRCQPASKTGRLALAWTYYLARRFDDALAALDKARVLDPDYLPIFQLESDVLLATGRDEQALRACQRALELAGDSADDVAALAETYERSGIEGVLRCLVSWTLEQTPDGEGQRVRLAGLEARLGETELALDRLELAYQERADDLVWLSVDPAFDNLRSSDEFADLLARLGLDA